MTELAGRPVQAGQVSDAALIEASLVDPSRFAAIFDRHSDVILRYACVRVGPDVARSPGTGAPRSSSGGQVLNSR